MRFFDRTDQQRMFSAHRDCGWQRLEDDRAKAILHQGGYWAFGLYGQVLYINPRKNIIGVYLGADRFEDFQNIIEKAMEVL